MRFKFILGSAALVALVALSGCGGGKGGVMAGRGAPDEFLVSKRAPLTIPPDFALTPPKPGAPRPQEADSSQQALSAMFGGPAKRSETEGDIISETKVVPEPGIRSAAFWVWNELAARDPPASSVARA